MSCLYQVCYEEHDLQKGDVDEMTLALFRGDLIRTISLSRYESYICMCKSVPCIIVLKGAV